MLLLIASDLEQHLLISVHAVRQASATVQYAHCSPHVARTHTHSRAHAHTRTRTQRHTPHAHNASVLVKAGNHVTSRNDIPLTVSPILTCMGLLTCMLGATDRPDIVDELNQSAVMRMISADHVMCVQVMQPR